MDTSTKRVSILKSAEKIMAQKGLDNTSIAEIAREAQVLDSVIYQFFKGKEDLLFSVAAERIETGIRILNEHLDGIRDPESKLRKMIWFHLHDVDTYREFASLVLLESRSKRSFYRHRAYNFIRKYAGILLSILEDGVKASVFRPDVNLRLLREMIFGVLDWETLGCLASKETEKIVSDLEDIMALIIPIISVRPKETPAVSDKAEKILCAGEKVFAEKGYNGATVSDIARSAGVAEGTVYEYFNNKEELLFSIPRRRFEEHHKSLTEIFERRNPVAKLGAFIQHYYHLYTGQSSFFKVFLLDVQYNKKFYFSPAYEPFLMYCREIERVIEEGKKDGSIRGNVNSRVFRNLYLGAFSHMAIRWYILEDETKHEKTQEINEVVSLLSRAVT